MRRTLLAGLIVSIASLSLLGCEEDDPLTVEGSLDLELAEAQTGFDFAAGTVLAGSAADVTPDCAAGGCTLSVDHGCRPVSFEFWLERGTDGEQGLGLRSFQLALDTAGSTVQATVATAEGDVVYSSSGSADCVVSDLSSIGVEDDATIDLDCLLAADPDLSAHATAHLFLSECAVDSERECEDEDDDDHDGHEDDDDHDGHEDDDDD